MKRREFITVAAAGLWGCNRPATKVTEPIHVSVNRRPGMAGVYFAQERGYFEKASIPVAFQTLGLGMEVVPLMAAGKIDVGFFPLNAAVFNAVAKGAAIKLVAGREVLKPGCSDFGAIYGRREIFPNGLDDLHSLRGKTVCTGTRLQLNHFTLDVVLESAGLTMNDMKIQQLPGAEALAALRNKQVDAISANHIYGPQLRERFTDLVWNAGFVKVKPGFQYAHVFFGKRLLEQPDDVGGRLLAAYLRGTQEYLKGGNPKFLDELAVSDGLDPMEARKFCREDAVEDGAILKDSIEYYNSWAVKRGHCEKMIPFEQMTEQRFLDYAHKHPV